MKRIATILCLAALPTLAAAQDSLQLTDGRFLVGPKIEPAGDNFKITFPHGEVTLPKAAVKTTSIVEAGAAKANSPEDQEKIDKGLVRLENRWLTAEARDKELAKRAADRDAKIKEAMSHREWANKYEMKTEQFAFEFTIDPDVMKKFADLMEVYYKEFTKEWGIKKPSKLGRLKVCFYHDEDYFHQVSGAQQGVIGYFRFVQPLELNFFYDRLDPEFTVDVMFHEANHYLTTLIDPKFRYPIWVNESLAEYYGASAWDWEKKQMTVGPLQEGRLAVIQDAIRNDEWQKLDTLIRLKHGEFNATHYAWGWSFVHWLLENKDTNKKFKEFYLGLARDKNLKREPIPPAMKEVPADDVAAYLLKSLGAKSVDELQEGWYAYVKTLKPSSGRGYYEAGRIAMMEDMPIKAQRYLKIALDMDFKGPQVYAELSRAQYRKHEYEDAAASMRTAIALDPLNAELYLGLAKAVRFAEDEEAATKLNWLALEVAKATSDPNEYSILVDLGPDYVIPASASAGGK